MDLGNGRYSRDRTQARTIVEPIVQDAGRFRSPEYDVAARSASCHARADIPKGSQNVAGGRGAKRRHHRNASPIRIDRCSSVVATHVGGCAEHFWHPCPGCGRLVLAVRRSSLRFDLRLLSCNPPGCLVPLVRRKSALPWGGSRRENGKLLNRVPPPPVSSLTRSFSVSTRRLFPGTVPSLGNCSPMDVAHSGDFLLSTNSSRPSPIHLPT